MSNTFLLVIWCIGVFMGVQAGLILAMWLQDGARRLVAAAFRKWLPKDKVSNR